jgi:predicted nucleic acid-binding protein
MGPVAVLDTSAALYHLRGDAVLPANTYRYVISVITELELLVVSTAEISEQHVLQGFLRQCPVVPITDSVKQHTARIRASARLKLPDAIIAGTAAALGAALFTADRDFAKVSGITVFYPPYASSPDPTAG